MHARVTGHPLRLIVLAGLQVRLRQGDRHAAGVGQQPAARRSKVRTAAGGVAALLPRAAEFGEQTHELAERAPRSVSPSSRAVGVSSVTTAAKS